MNSVYFHKIFHRKCRIGGTFSTKKICFNFKACPALSTPQFVSMSTTKGTEFEDEAIYECNEGFEIVGNSRRSCQSTGSWSGTAPTCKQIGRSLLKEKSKRVDKKVANIL